MQHPIHPQLRATQILHQSLRNQSQQSAARQTQSRDRPKMARTKPRTRTRHSQRIQEEQQTERGSTPAQMEEIATRKHRLQRSRTEVDSSQPRGSRRAAATQSQGRSGRQRNTRAHRSQMGSQQWNLLPLRRSNRHRPRATSPDVTHARTPHSHQQRRQARP